MDKMTYIALRQRHPIKPIKGWAVWQSGKIIFDSNFKGLCDYFVQTNALKNTCVKPIR